MIEIQKCFNKIGDFYLSGKGEPFQGTLYSDSGMILLSARVRKGVCGQNGYVSTIVGMVNAIEMTLLTPYVVSIESPLTSLFSNVVFSPSEIILGGKYLENVNITEIRAEIPQLDKFTFFDDAQVTVCDEYRRLDLKIEQKPVLSCKDAMGEINIYSFIGIVNDLVCPELYRKNMIQYCFSNITDLKQGIFILSSCRNLLSFFADYYLEMSNFSFIDVGEKQCSLIVNNKEDVSIKKEPFIITRHYLEDSFEYIWNKWRDFCDKDKGIVDLFYEIISDSSTRMNLFLNICQGIEIYSYTNREKDVRMVRELYIKQFNYNPKDKKIILEYRIFDILKYVGIYINEKDEVIKNISETIATTRKKYVHKDMTISTMPSFHFITVYGNFLRVVLLMMIYKHLGITVDWSKTILPKYQYLTRIVLDEAYRKRIEMENGE